MYILQALDRIQLLHLQHVLHLLHLLRLLQTRTPAIPFSTAAAVAPAPSPGPSPGLVQPSSGKAAFTLHCTVHSQTQASAASLV